jgi:ribonuclease P protein component
MFKKANRITTREFSHYFKTGKRHNFKYLSVIYNQSEIIKIAVVTGKKVAKSAVKRNALKRRVLAILRKTDLLPGAYIILLKPNFSSLSRKTAEQNTLEAIALFKKNK